MISGAVFSKNLEEELDRRMWCLIRLQNAIRESSGSDICFSDILDLHRGDRDPSEEEVELFCKALGVEKIRLTKTREQLERIALKELPGNKAEIRKLKIELDKANRDRLQLQGALNLWKRLITHVRRSNA